MPAIYHIGNKRASRKQAQLIAEADRYNHHAGEFHQIGDVMARDKLDHVVTAGKFGEKFVYVRGDKKSPAKKMLGDANKKKEALEQELRSLSSKIKTLEKEHRKVAGELVHVEHVADEPGGRGARHGPDTVNGHIRRRSPKGRRTKK